MCSSTAVVERSKRHRYSILRRCAEKQIYRLYYMYRRVKSFTMRRRAIWVEHYVRSHSFTWVVKALSIRHHSSKFHVQYTRQHIFVRGKLPLAKVKNRFSIYSLQQHATILCLFFFSFVFRSNSLYVSAVYKYPKINREKKNKQKKNAGD